MCLKCILASLKLQVLTKVISRINQARDNDAGNETYLAGITCASSCEKEAQLCEKKHIYTPLCVFLNTRSFKSDLL